jgi:hypothetical protein
MLIWYKKVIVPIVTAVLHIVHFRQIKPLPTSRSVLAPFNRVQIDALLHQLPQRAELS